MVYTKEKFKELWEANEWGSSITYDDIADCAVAWGISEGPRILPIDGDLAYRVLKAAQVNDAEEYNPNPAPKKREEIGCGYCIHEEVCEMRKTRTKSTRELAKECGHFIHYKVLDESTDWEQRRYEIAREIMANCFHEDEMKGVSVEVMSLCAVEAADELIKQLKWEGGFQD